MFTDSRLQLCFGPQGLLPVVMLTVEVRRTLPCGAGSRSNGGINIFSLFFLLRLYLRGILVCTAFSGLSHLPPLQQNCCNGLEWSCYAPPTLPLHDVILANQN